jgi:5-histidylcysteine sulfoxide synthase
LFSVLREDSVYFQQPDRLRHPLIFYWGHTACFFINKLIVSKVIKNRIDPKLESTCAIGVDEMSWDDLNSEHYDWPTVDQVREYRDKVRTVVDRVIQSAELKLPIAWNSPFWIILMGIEHERIHFDTSSVLFRQLPIQDVISQPMFKLCPNKRTDPSSVPENELIPVASGVTHLGKPFDHGLYGWDNEFTSGETARSVEGFEASKYLVSNKDFYDFMLDGGYDNKELWTEEGWKFVQFKQSLGQAHPIFWVPQDKDNSSFKYRSLADEIDMPWDWPIDCNYLEAKAFCNWKSQKTGKKTSLANRRGVVLTPRHVPSQ